MVRLILLAIAAALSAAVAADEPSGPMADRALDELSGLVVSRADAGILWGHNDTGSGPVLYRIGPNGEALGREFIRDAQAGDWEDIAAFRDAGGPALLIGDIGDNLAIRGFVTLYAVRDPGRKGTPTLLWKLDVRYPDGARDCEALAVDEAAREILLVSKRDEPARLYRVPLPAKPPRGAVTAELVGTLPRPDAVGLRDRLRAPIASTFFNSPTALDISADGLTAVLITPRAAYVHRRQPGRRWSELLLKPAPALELPAFDQIEAGALSPDGRTLTVGTEGKPSRWARLTLAP